MKKYRVVVFPDADKMLEDHLCYLSRINISAAKKLYHEFWSTVNDLREYPFLYPPYESKSGKPYRKALFNKRYQIIYLISEDTVYIHAVRDCRMDPGRGWKA